MDDDPRGILPPAIRLGYSFGPMITVPEYVPLLRRMREADDAMRAEGDLRSRQAGTAEPVRAPEDHRGCLASGKG